MKIEIKNRFTSKIIFDSDLSYKDLSGIVAPRGSRFDGSRFVDSRFDGSRFVDSRFVGSSFDGSRFVGSRFDGSRFDGSSLESLLKTNFDTTMFRDDIWAVCSSAPLEVGGILKALQEGKVNGSTYEGDCACLVGTVANIRGCNYKALGILKPNANRPAEQWFMQIRKGDTPDTNPAAKQAHAWISEWIKNMKAAFQPVNA